MRTETRIALATLAVATGHSLLASRAAKDIAARLFGERTARVWYRPFFIIQSLASFGALLAYYARQPTTPVWTLKGFPAAMCQGVRLAALGGMAAAARQVGVGNLTGVAAVKAWSRQDQDIALGPEAQGPNLEAGRKPTGPFRFSRHPLNFLGLPLLWLSPGMNRKRIVFNTVASLYLLLGSIHEEVRLKAAYGERYREYQANTSFLFGRKRSKSLAASSAERTR